MRLGLPETNESSPIIQHAHRLGQLMRVQIAQNANARKVSTERIVSRSRCKCKPNKGLCHEYVTRTQPELIVAPNSQYPITRRVGVCGIEIPYLTGKMSFGDLCDHELGQCRELRTLLYTMSDSTLARPCGWIILISHKQRTHLVVLQRSSTALDTCSPLTPHPPQHPLHRQGYLYIPGAVIVGAGVLNPLVGHVQSG